jgi:hypothetical protein
MKSHKSVGGQVPTDRNSGRSVLHEDERKQFCRPFAFRNSKEMHPFPAMATHRAAHCDNVLSSVPPCSLRPEHPNPVAHQTSAALVHGSIASDARSTRARCKKGSAPGRIGCRRKARARIRGAPPSITRRCHVCAQMAVRSSASIPGAKAASVV